MQALREGTDYYLDENGLLVFTAAYHLARGTCCGSGCRHCPFDHASVPSVTTGPDDPEENNEEDA